MNAETMREEAMQLWPALEWIIVGSYVRGEYLMFQGGDPHLLKVHIGFVGAFCAMVSFGFRSGQRSILLRSEIYSSFPEAIAAAQQAWQAYVEPLVAMLPKH